MIALAVLSLLALLASVGLTLSGAGSPAAASHLAFAVGIVPLIFGAMTHFVGVLTRTGEAAPGIRILPFLAQGAGVMAVASMLSAFPRWSLHAAAAIDLGLSLVLLGWILSRVRACVGAPHPGWRWYALALVCFSLALLLVLLSAAIPQHYPLLRLVHLHLNILGFIGLAAFGTLPVLLPTALFQADPLASTWLRRMLLPMAAGIFLTAGAAGLRAEAGRWADLCSLLGAGILLIVTVSLLRQWLSKFSWRVLWNDGVSVALVAAVIAYLALLAGGVLHGLGLIAARPSIPAWGCAFLLPLVTGALSQLLPVWRWPGPRLPKHTQMRQILARHGQWRAILFLGGGICLLFGWSDAGAALALMGMATFLYALAISLKLAK